MHSQADPLTLDGDEMRRAISIGEIVAVDKAIIEEAAQSLAASERFQLAADGATCRLLAAAAPPAEFADKEAVEGAMAAAKEARVPDRFIEAAYRYLPLPTVTYRHLPSPTVTYRHLPLQARVPDRFIEAAGSRHRWLSGGKTKAALGKAMTSAKKKSSSRLTVSAHSQATAP